MSGEFGRYSGYIGYIDDIIQQVADDCDSPDATYHGTRAFGEWLGKHVFQLAGIVAYNEAYDDHPRESNIVALEQAKAGLDLVIEAFRRDIADTTPPEA